MDTKQVSQAVRKGLQKKVEKHNEKYGDDARKRVTLRMLIAVFKRGVGAYNTNPESVRPNVRSSDQWAYARVNAFLYACRTLRFRGGKFDTDLLPSAHPLSSKKSGTKGKYDSLNFTIPKGAKEEAKRGLAWRREYGRGGTSVGLNSARYILNNTTAGPEKVRHIAKYFPRHEVDKRAEGWRQGEDGYPSNGRIAWALWGGEAGKTWSQKLVRAMNRIDDKKDSALELVSRRNELYEKHWDYRTNRFRNVEAKELNEKFHFALQDSWEFALNRMFVDLFRKQNLGIQQVIARNSSNIFTTPLAVNTYIDSNFKSWGNDMFGYYVSMLTDFAYFQAELLLPENFADGTYTYEKQTGRKNRHDIINNGFNPSRSGQGQLPVGNLKYNREAIGYANERIAKSIPDMAKTSKDRFSRAFRRSYDEALSKGLTGNDLTDYVADGVRGTLSKQNLNRGLMIARTEATGLANYGRKVGAKATGLLYTKEWNTSQDQLVRDAHMSLSGTEIDENKSFVYDGYKLDYPGDYSNGAPPNLTINCRCYLEYHEKRGM